MYRLNPDLVNPLLLPLFERLRRFVLPVLGALLAVRLGWILNDNMWHRRELTYADQEAIVEGLPVFALLVSAAFALTVLEHWLAFALLHLPLPAGRTGIFFITLSILLAGIASAAPTLSRGGWICRNSLITMLCILSIYHLFSLRLTYFGEWEYQSDLKQAYAVVACYNHEHNVRNVEASWYYDSGMNFYRLLSGRETFGPFSSMTPHPTDRDMYVLHGDLERDFIDSRGLKVVYRGSSSMVVAVRPAIADGPRGHATSGLPCRCHYYSSSMAGGERLRQIVSASAENAMITLVSYILPSVNAGIRTRTGVVPRSSVTP
jgi:hypothetical protein